MQSSSSPSTKRILIVDPDPYLAYLIRLALPAATVVQAGSRAELPDRLDPLPDLVVAESEMVAAAGRDAKVLAIIDRGHPAPSGATAVLRRPYSAAEVAEALAAALDGRRPASGPVERARSWLGPARVAAVLLAAAAEAVSLGVTPGMTTLLVVALAYSIVRLFRWGGADRTVAVADVVFATVVVAATGGHASSFTGFALMASIEAGLALGLKAGGGAAAAMALASLPHLPHIGATGESRQLVVWATLFPLSAWAGALAARMATSGRGAGRAALLEETNRILGALDGVARVMPEGIDRNGILRVLPPEICKRSGADASLLVTSDGATWTAVASCGPATKLPRILDGSDPALAALADGRVSVVTRGSAPASLRPLLEPWGCWLAAPIERNGAALGVVLAACPGHERHAAVLSALREVASEGATALENAGIFERIRRLSVDAERRRLARELHDGVAQSLAHVRLELDFLRRHATDDTSRHEADRLGRVVEGALGDVRGAIRGLHDQPASRLSEALRGLVRDLDGVAGPEIVFRERPPIDVDAQGGHELYRVAQEALSNALRHSGARRISLELRGDADVVELIVSDDGSGFDAGAVPGIGIAAMRQRAEALGAEFELAADGGRGTTLSVKLPRRREPAA